MGVEATFTVWRCRAPGFPHRTAMCAEAELATVSFDAAKAGKLSRDFQDCEQIGSFEKSACSRCAGRRGADVWARSAFRLGGHWSPATGGQGVVLGKNWSSWLLRLYFKYPLPPLRRSRMRPSSPWGPRLTTKSCPSSATLRSECKRGDFFRRAWGKPPTVPVPIDWDPRASRCGHTYSGGRDFRTYKGCS